MAVTDSPTSTGERGVPPPPARLVLAPVRVLPGRPGVDGVWWPRSRDLSRELPALTDALDDGWGRVTRATVDPAGWPVAPRAVRVAGRTVRVGWLPDGRRPYELILLSHTAGRCELLVIPPETAGPAAWPASAASAAQDHPAADTTMAREEGTRTVAESRSRGRRAAGGTLLPRPSRPAGSEHRPVGS